MVREKNSVTSVHLTARDLRLFKKLSAAGWLTSTQIRNHFFPQKSTNAVCKRLRKLAEERYIALARTSSTEAGLYRLAGRGKLALIEHAQGDAADIAIPTQLPRTVKHFVAVNNLRFHFEKLTDPNGSRLLFFLSERELCRSYQDFKSLLHPTLALFKMYRIIPDAIARVRIVQGGRMQEMDLAVEYDAGTEHANFFGRTKIRQYGALVARYHEQLGNFKVLTFAERIGRIVSLMRQAVQHQPPRHLFYFALMGKLNQ